MGIPPIFQRAHRHRLAGTIGTGRCRSRGNPPTARGCDFEPGTPKWRPVFLWPGASVSTGAPPRKSRSESTDQRLLLTGRLWSQIEPKPDADILLRARQAADRVLT